MTEPEQKERAQALKQVMQSHGGKIFLAHIEEEIKEGWEQFIDLAVEKKTSKAAYDAQAKYKVLKDLKEWVESEIKLGE